MERKLVNQLLRSLWVFFILALIVAAAIFVTPLVYPFLIGWIVAYILNPLVNLLHRKARFPRWLAVSVSLTLFFGAAATILTAMITRIVVEIINLSKSIESNIEWWKNEILRWIESDGVQSLLLQLGNFYQENPNYQETINKSINSTADQIAAFGTYAINLFFNSILSFLTSLPNIATLTIIVLLAAFFISKDWYKHMVSLSGMFPSNLLGRVKIIGSDLQKALFGYVRAQFIMISITAVFVIVGLLVLNVKYAITIGLLIGLVDLLPYLGVGAAMIPWIVYTFTLGDTSLGIGLTVLYAIILVVRQIIEPKVLSTSIGLDPLPTLIAMFVGLKLFGVFGLIIGPVTLVILSALHRAGVFRDIRDYILQGSRAG